jgi:hypothetical protein
VEGEEPPLGAAGFDEVDLAAGAEFDAELELDAGVAAGGGADDFAGAAAALELAGAAAEESDAAVDFFERDFLVVESAEPEAVFDASVFEAEADFEESDDASLESAAAFFDFDFLVVPVEESEAVEADFESAEASVESAAFFDFDFLVVPVEESEFEAVESSAAAFDFLDLDDAVDEAELSSDAADFFLDFAAEPLVLESSVVLPSAAAFFFFFFAVLLSELESLDEPLADDEADWAFADFAATDADPSTKAAQASAVNIFCQSVFMIVPPVSKRCEMPMTEFGLRVLFVGEARGVGLGLLEQAGGCGRLKSRQTAIEMAAERRGQIRFKVVHDGVDNFLGLILRQAGLLHNYLDEFVHG